jgi:hypothetical protein
MPRPPALDDEKKRQIVTLVSAGLSRLAAAKFVGCAVSTIYRTAKKDAAFAAELDRATIQPMLFHLHNIQKHAEKSWRASAWYLERVYPHQFGRRQPETYTREDLQEKVNLICGEAEKVPDKKARRWVKSRVRRIYDAIDRWADDHVTPWERNNLPTNEDLFSSTQPVHVVSPKNLKSKNPVYVRDTYGTHFVYDADHIHDLLEWHNPKPNPLSQDWLEFCSRQGFTEGYKKRREAEYAAHQKLKAEGRAGPTRYRFGPDLWGDDIDSDIHERRRASILSEPYDPCTRGKSPPADDDEDEFESPYGDSRPSDSRRGDAPRNTPRDDQELYGHDPEIARQHAQDKKPSFVDERPNQI